MRLLLTIALWISLCAYHSVVSAKTEKIMIATDDWEPYISKKRAGYGEFSERVTAVFKKMGMTTEFIFAPWKRVEALVEKGEVYAGIPYSYTEERHKTFDYSVTIMNSPNVFFYKIKNYPKGIHYSKLEELAHYRISGVTGYWYETLFAQAKLNVEYVTTDEQSINKLYFNRVDLVATDERVGWALIAKLYPHEVSQFAVTGKPFLTTDLRLLVSKKYPNAAQITQQFNTFYQSMYKK
jgi:polar amino acid transport system substrate-binding protein